MHTKGILDPLATIIHVAGEVLAEVKGLFIEEQEGIDGLPYPANVLVVEVEVDRGLWHVTFPEHGWVVSLYRGEITGTYYSYECCTPEGFCKPDCPCEGCQAIRSLRE